MHRTLFAALAATVILALGSGVAGAAPRPVRLSVEAQAAIDVATVERFFTQVTIDEYVKAVTLDEYLRSVAIDEYVSSVVAGENAARAAAATPPVARAGGTTVGACTGFAIPDYIIQRESGGNPSAMNPSGAYGCAQTLLGHYYGGSCSGLDPYTIDGQRQCVMILSNGGTNLAPWAETR